MKKMEIISRIKKFKESGNEDEFLFYSGLLHLINNKGKQAEDYFYKVINCSENKKLVQNSYHNVLSLYFQEKNFNKVRQVLKSNKSINNYRTYLTVSYIQQFSTVISLMGSIVFVFMIFVPSFSFSLFLLLYLLSTFFFINLANYRIRIYRKFLLLPLFVVIAFIISRII